MRSHAKFVIPKRLIWLAVNSIFIWILAHTNIYPLASFVSNYFVKKNERKTNNCSAWLIHRHALTFNNNELVKVVFRYFQVTDRTFVVDAFFENPVQLLSGDWCLRRYIHCDLQSKQILILAEKENK